MKVNTMKRLLISILTTLMVGIQPFAAVALASEETPAPSPEASPTPAVGPQTTPGPTEPTGPQTTPGPSQPTGPEGSTYTFNEETGLWENGHYTWDPKTSQSAPKEDPGYYYNPETKTWETTEWKYNPTTGKYEEAPKPLDPQLVQLLGLLTGGQNAAGGSTIDTTGPNSNNSIMTNNKNTGFFDLFNRSSVSNYIDLAAITGNVNITGNTLAGDGQSGDASALSNILNVLNSVWNLTGGKLLTLFGNIFGDVTGDLMLNPDSSAASAGTVGGASCVGGSNSNTGPNSNNSIDCQADSTIKVNNQNSGVINNDVDINAKSGDANVANNTTAGGAKSGNARVVLNLLNLINSAINSGQSFVGVLNIFGNLNGDILFPPGFLDGLISAGSDGSGSTNTGSNSNTGPNSNNQVQANNNNNLSVNNANNSTINNNINTNATTGQANVSGNTQAGSAKSGNANSNITLLNLTGQSIVGKNAILVFVNVLGNWVGLIMNAPEGTTSAVLGGGATAGSNSNTGPNSNNQVQSSNNSDAQLTNSNQNTINNNIDLNAQSGDANVSGNTLAGNAQSGDADVAANILNVTNSDLSLTNWFGILFVNVFGSWFGSLGVDTAAGNQPQTITLVNTPSTTGQASAAACGNCATAPKAKKATTYTLAGSAGSSADHSNINSDDTSSSLIAGNFDNGASVKAATDSGANDKMPLNNWLFAGAFFGVAGALLLVERLLAARRMTKII